MTTQTTQQAERNRDMQCAADVGRMAALGRFETEFTVYGCAYLEHGDVTYRICSESDRLYHFYQQCILQKLYPTAIYQHSERIGVPSGMREIVAQSVRVTLAEKIVALYPRVFFETLESMSALPANNESFPLLLAMQDVIDGHYDALELQLFDGTLQMALEAKLLDDWHYQILKNWVQKIEHEMEDTPVIERNINRTFYGFCYQESDQSVKCVIDAQYSRVFEQQQQHWAVGHLTAPIIQQQVWFEHFGEFPALRKRFKETMLTLENDAYFRFLQELKALPAAVSPEIFAEALVLMETEGSPDAVADLKRYGYRWNCL